MRRKPGFACNTDCTNIGRPAAPNRQSKQLPPLGPLSPRPQQTSARPRRSQARPAKRGTSIPEECSAWSPPVCGKTKNTRRWSEPQTTFLSELTAQPAVKLGLLTPQGPHNRANWISAKVAATAGGRAEAQASIFSSKGLRTATCRRLAFLAHKPKL